MCTPRTSILRSHTHWGHVSMNGQGKPWNEIVQKIAISPSMMGEKRFGIAVMMKQELGMLVGK